MASSKVAGSRVRTMLAMELPLNYAAVFPTAVQERRPGGFAVRAESGPGPRQKQNIRRLLGCKILTSGPTVDKITGKAKKAAKEAPKEA